MSATIRIYFNLLVLFGVLCQGIIGTLSEKDNGESSELLHRQKRVINGVPGNDRKELIKNFPYMVQIKEYRFAHFCAGVIMTNNIVLTVAKCVNSALQNYRVYSGISHMSRTRHRVVHNIIGRNILPFGHRHRVEDGIALITVSPPLTYSINTRNLPFYDGHIHPGLQAVVSGWGCNSTENPGTEFPEHLRSITVPIISNQDCQRFYDQILPISETDICTLDLTGRQYCGVDDAGAPLVVVQGNMKYLVGIHLWNGGVIGFHNPDVFVNLQYPRYKSWIAETIPIMEADRHH